MQTQGFKNSSHFEESKPKDPKLAPPHNNMVEPAKKEGKKKKRSREHRQERISDKKKQSSTTSFNTETPKKKMRARYFNCNKISHYINDYTKLQKN